MSETLTTKCDGRNCAKVKAESNHWFKMAKLDHQFTVWRAGDPSGAIPSGYPILDFCSPACALNACSTWMDRPLAEAAKS